jgi:transcriptional regulator with XRE-family HTH domain
MIDSHTDSGGNSDGVAPRFCDSNTTGRYLFPNHIAEYRRAKHLEVSVLAVRLGINRTHLAAIEAGKRTPSVRLLFSVARALSVTMDDLVDATALARLLSDAAPESPPAAPLV